MPSLLAMMSTVTIGFFSFNFLIFNFSVSPQLPDHIRVRLQYIHDSAPSKPGSGQDKAVAANLIAWLQRLQFKMGQIELQASNATQFYTV